MVQPGAPGDKTGSFASPRPAEAQMDSSGVDRTLVCTRCRHTRAPWHPGLAMIGRLRCAIDTVCDAVGDHLDVCRTAAITDCGRTCCLACRGSRREIYLFGDVKAETDIDDLVATMHADAGPDAPYSGDCDSGAFHGRAPATILGRECTEVRLQ